MLLTCPICQAVPSADFTENGFEALLITYKCSKCKWTTGAQDFFDDQAQSAWNFGVSYYLENHLK